MFERFTKVAREVVVLAQEQARTRGADRIRTEHLLLAMFALPDHPARTVLESAGIRQADVEADVDRMRGGPATPDAEALATLGIDLDEVRRQVEEAFGPGALDRTRAAVGREGRRRTWHIPFDRTTKKALETALREALLLEHGHIGTEHLLLGLLASPLGAAHHLLTGRGLGIDAARHLVDDMVRRRRAS